MIQKQRILTSEEIYKQPIPNVTALTIAANKLAGGANSGTNPYALRNEVILREQKKRIRYKNGYTLPATAEALQMDAERRVRHSRTLDRNICKANPGTSRSALMDAHHIVAQQDMRADAARKLLFNWGIGINDADNGVYMPRYRTSVVPSLPNCPDHQSIHTFRYFLTVTNALLDVSEEPTQVGRDMLRSIKASLIAGTFPF